MSQFNFPRQIIQPGVRFSPQNQQVAPGVQTLRYDSNQARPGPATQPLPGPAPGASRPLEPWAQYVARSNPNPAATHAPTGNPLADHYQAQADMWDQRRNDPQWQNGGPDAGPALKNFYREQGAFWGGPVAAAPYSRPAQTVYHANGSISNPPAQDPGFRVYNHISDMPAGEQADIHAYRSGQSPQMMPDPSKQTPQIGVPARGQGTPSRGVFVQPGQVQTGPQTSFNSTQEMRQAMLSGLAADMAKAQQGGDHKTLYDLFAQRAALDNGGFQGHAAYVHQRDTALAQQNHLNAPTPGGRGGIGLPVGPDGMLDVNAARTLGMKETNSAAGGDEFANNAAVQNYTTLEGKGQPFKIDPALAPAILDSRAPHLAKLFANDEKTGPALSPQDILSGLRKKDPSVYENPGGLKGQASLAMLRQLHGDTLEDALALPANPADYTPDLHSPIGSLLGGWASDRVGDLGAGLGNLFHWRNGVFDPAGEYFRQAQARADLSYLEHPPTK